MAQVTVDGVGPYNVTRTADETLQLINDGWSKNAAATLPLENDEILLVSPRAAGVVWIGG